MKWLLLMCVIVGCGQATAPAVREIDVRSIMASGDGHDFMKLSDRDRLRLGMEIENTIGRHEGYDYAAFLHQFYSRAEAENPALLNRPISETAAVAAAIEIQ